VLFALVRSFWIDTKVPCCMDKMKLDSFSRYVVIMIVGRTKDETSADGQVNGSRYLVIAHTIHVTCNLKSTLDLINKCLWSIHDSLSCTVTDHLIQPWHPYQ
jgi:hypothetical protein